MKSIISAIDNLAVKKKILLVLCLPLALCVTLLVVASLKYLDDYKDADQVNHLVVLSGILNGVAGNFAVERGLTAGFLASQGSKGSKKVIAQRKKADHWAEQLSEYIKSGDFSQLNEKMQSQLIALNNTLDGRSTLRDRVDRVDAPDAFSYYSSLNSNALTIIQELGFMVTHPEISAKINSFANLLWLKERAGQERGALNGVFVKGTASIAKRNVVNSYIRDQETYTQVFYKSAANADITAFNSAMTSVENPVKELRQKFLTYEKRLEIVDVLEHYLGPSGFMSVTNTLATDINGENRVKLVQSLNQVENAVTSLEQMARSDASLSSHIAVLKNTANELRTWLNNTETNNYFQFNSNALSSSVQALSSLGAVDASEWFRLSTERIKAVNGVAMGIAGEINAMAQDLKFSALLTLSSLAVAMLLLFTVAAAIGILIGKRIVSNLQKISSTMAKVRNQFDFSQRVALAQQDEIGQMANDFNALLDGLQSAFKEVNHVMQAVSVGQFDRRIESDMKGDLVLLKECVNDSTSSIANTMDALSEIMHSMEAGKFSVRMHESVEGEFRQSVDRAMQTTEQALQEISLVVQATREGDFSKRVDADLQGDLKTIKDNINQSMTGLEDAMSEIVDVTTAQKQGNLTVRITGDYNGQLGRLKSAINETMDIISKAIDDVGVVMHEMSAGNFDARITTDLIGDFAPLKTAINDGLSKMSTALSEIVSVSEAQRNGELSVRVMGEYSGQPELLKQAINDSMRSLVSLVSEITDVMQAMREGDFTKRITAEFKGDFGPLKENANLSLDAIEHAINEIKDVSTAMQEGNFDQRIEGNYEGTLRSMKVALNDSTESLDQAFNEISDVMVAMKDGDFSGRIKVPLAGKLELLKEYINDTVSSVESAMNEIVTVSQAQENGDLSQRILGSYNGEIAQLKNAINSSLDRIQNVIGTVKTSSNSLLHSARELASGSAELSLRTEKQASNLEEIAAAMEEMASTIDESSTNISSVSGYIDEVRGNALNGVELSQKASTSMTQIAASSSAMSEIVGVIDEIAFQTNLLALNAAVEAARAGESGRGFAVVAAEVRQLAQRSSTAAKEIKDLIGDSHEKVEVGVSFVEDGVGALDDIASSVATVSEMANGIDEAAREQKSALMNINESVAQMDSMTQMNARLVDDTNSASKALENHAQSLSEEVSFFNISRSA